MKNSVPVGAVSKIDSLIFQGIQGPGAARDGKENDF